MIEVERVCKRFGSFPALDDVTLAVAAGELVALLGPSGSGKTTLLRVMAGLEQAESGIVRIAGIDASGLHPRDRGVGFVFQHYALFRHMKVADNIAFGLKARKGALRPAKADIARRVERLLALMQLEGLGNRYPAQLSGGQRQRVALARALAIEPRLLLLDEPFGALDAQVRKELRRWLRRLHDEMRLTGVFVTHDQEEALEVADRVVVMNRGRIEQVGSPIDIYDNPATPFVYRFLGNVNAIPCEIRNGRAWIGGLDLACANGDVGSGPGTLFIRPHDVALLPDHEPGSMVVSGLDHLEGAPLPEDEPGAPAVVRHVAVLGGGVRVEVVLDDGPAIDVETTREERDRLALEPGRKIRVAARSARCFIDRG